jgi:hypothetical protein
MSIGARVRGLGVAPLTACPRIDGSSENPRNRGRSFVPGFHEVALVAAVDRRRGVAGARGAPASSRACRGCNVLLVTIDTLGASIAGAFEGGSACTDPDRPVSKARSRAPTAPHR